jgi:hypothetical protein
MEQAMTSLLKSGIDNGVVLQVPPPWHWYFSRSFNRKYKFSHKYIGKPNPVWVSVPPNGEEPVEDVSPAEFHLGSNTLTLLRQEGRRPMPADSPSQFQKAVEAYNAGVEISNLIYDEIGQILENHSEITQSIAIHGNVAEYETETLTERHLSVRCGFMGQTRITLYDAQIYLNALIEQDNLRNYRLAIRAEMKRIACTALRRDEELSPTLVKPYLRKIFPPEADGGRYQKVLDLYQDARTDDGGGWMILWAVTGLMTVISGAKIIYHGYRYGSQFCRELFQAILNPEDGNNRGNDDRTREPGSEGEPEETAKSGNNSQAPEAEDEDGPEENMRSGNDLRSPEPQVKGEPKVMVVEKIIYNNIYN